LTDSLALKYRPSTFQDMVGQRINAVVLDRMVAKHAVPDGLLFVGPSGTGKTSCARILASALNEGNVDSGMYTIEIDAASNGGVDDMRKLIESLRYSTGGAYRVIIIDEAHSLTREAFNALLKTLEEPPTGTKFVLVTTEPDKIPETVQTRLREFTFRLVSPSEIANRLLSITVAEGVEVDKSLLQHIAIQAQGSVRRSVNLLDQVIVSEIQTVEEYEELNGVVDTAPALLAAMLTDDSAHVFEIMDQQLAATGSPTLMASQLVECLRDMQILRAGGSLTLTGPALEARKDLSLRVEKERVITAIRLVWDLKTRIKPTDDPTRNLEMLLILMMDVLTRGKAPAPSTRPAARPYVETMPLVPAPHAEKKLSLSEIQRRR
jgi:DNA polymerase-3 subunit gamma/tau